VDKRKSACGRGKPGTRPAIPRTRIEHQFESAKIGLPLASLISDTHNF
jgi:hypothetical protein